MKTFILVFLIFLSHGLYAQNSIFVRVYDLKGKKIAKGHVRAVTDSSLQLTVESSANIPVQSIGCIKTRRSGGHNILVGSIVCTASAAMAMAAFTSAIRGIGVPSYTAWEGAALGAIAGLPEGVVLGSISLLFKSSKTFFVAGNLTKWKAFQSTIASLYIDKIRIK